MMAAIDQQARASTLITFEDTHTAAEQPLYNGYGGLLWQNVQTMNTDWWAQTNNPINGYVYGAVSPPTVAWVPTDGLSDRASATISSSTPFGFISAALTSAWNDNLKLQVYGYLNGQIVGSQTLTLNPFSPTIANFGFQKVDTVELIASGGTRDPAFPSPANATLPPSPIFVMDNITVDESGVSSPGHVSAAPEPSSFLVGVLLAGAFGLRRRICKIAW
jgi:hypothetical protein